MNKVESQLSPTTAGLVDSLARSLTQSGALPRTEMQALAKKK